jgi:cytidylate kinase
MSEIKIGLIGAAGCGSTTIATKISNEFGISIINSRDITREILKRDGYDYLSFVEKFLAVKEREFELVEKRISIEHQIGNFITDRTTLEHYVYAIDSFDKYSIEDLSILCERCKNNMKNYTHLFYLPVSKNLTNNNLRTLNVYYQKNIDYMINGVINEWGLNVVKLSDDIENNIKEISKIFGYDNNK